MNDINFVDTDTNTIKQEIIDTYEAITGRTLAAADPVRLFLETLASVMIKQRVWINYAAKQNLLYYSAGDYLDHIGYLVGCTRIAATAAQTTIRVTLSAVRPEAVTIPKGTRTATSDNVIFATDKAVVILAGNTTADIPATCTETGAVGNNIPIGSINMIVDPIAYVATMVNITASEGGSDIEDDDTYRARIRLAPESFSVAGPVGAYEYFVKSASDLIVDVAVVGPDDHPGEVWIYALLEGGVLPGAEMKQTILDYLNTDNVRPLTDHVLIKDPDVVNYDINLTYYIDRDNTTQESALKTAIESAIDTFVLECKSKLGRDVNPSRLIQLMTNAGAKRVDIASPAFTTVNASSVALVGTQAVNYGGLEDD